MGEDSVGRRGEYASERIRIRSDYPFEAICGYSRAVRTGSFVFVSGTTARGPALEGGVAVQLRAAIAIAASSLSEAGAELRHVVRTVVYLRDIGEAQAVAEVHGDVFGEIRPASTLVQVAALTPRTALVEIEITAMVHDAP